MSSSTNLTSHTPERTFVRNILIKTIMLFILANIVFAVWYPMPGLGRISAYNLLFPGRQRLPYGENPDRAYNLSLFNLEAMFAAHEISGEVKQSDEYRVILIGDSSTWGFLLPAEHTLSAFLNAMAMTIPDGRRVKVYNLGYPVMSLAKDILILSYAMRYQPDLIIWLVTLESFPYDKQLFAPLLQNNPQTMSELIKEYHLSLDISSAEFVFPSLWDRTIIGSRRPLADLIRLQLYGVMWAATGIDQDIPDTFTPRLEDLPADQSFHNLTPPQLQETDLAFEILSAGMNIAGETPVLLVNEPMFISQGQNSHIRYNFYYPRWAYDEYRRLMAEHCVKNGWEYLDVWDAIPPSEFTNTAVHMTPKGTQQLAQMLGLAIQGMVTKK